VREGVAVTGHGQQPSRDGLSRACQQAFLGKLERRGQEFMSHPAIGHRDLVDHGAGISGYTGSPGQHGVGDRGRQGVGTGAGHFSGVQRVAVRGGYHRRRPVRASAGRPEIGYQLRDLGVGQPGQPEPRHPRPALQFGKPSAGIAGEIFLPQRRDHEHGLLAQPDRQEGEQLAGGLIRPVQILQDKHHRRLGGKIGEHAVHAHEKAVPFDQHVAAVTGAVAGEQPPGPVAQRGQEWPVGQRRTGQRRRLPDPHLGPASGRACPLAQRLDEPGLANARLTGDQEHRGLACHHACVGR
jgi:hypothetical protein